jgi:hypothetical protein
MQKITEINIETGEVTERDETPEEFAGRQFAAQQEQEQASAKESALAKLEALGLTEEDIKAILL